MAAETLAAEIARGLRRRHLHGAARARAGSGCDRRRVRARWRSPAAWSRSRRSTATPRAYAFAVIGAEYVLRLLPRGTHDYAKFLQPAEIARVRAARRARRRRDHGPRLQPVHEDLPARAGHRRQLHDGVPPPSRCLTAPSGPRVLAGRRGAVRPRRHARRHGAGPGRCAQSRPHRSRPRARAARAAAPARIARRARPPGRRHVGGAGRSGLRDAARRVPHALRGGAVRRERALRGRSTPCSPRSTRARSPGASSPTRRCGSPRLCSTRCSSPRAQAPWSAATRRPSPSRIPRRSHSPPSSSASRRRAASTWAMHERDVEAGRAAGMRTLVAR